MTLSESSVLRRYQLSRRKFVVIGVIFAVSLVATVVTARVWKTRRALRSTSTVSPATQKPDKTHPQPRQLVRVWVHGDTIQPLLIYARPGKIKLRAENETHHNVSLVLESAPSRNVHQMLGKAGTQKSEKRADQDLDLAEGEYDFYEESRPELKGRLIVTSVLRESNQ